MPTKTGVPARVPGRNGFTYKQQYGVIVVCRNEREQKTVYRTLNRQGYKLKVVCA